MDAELIGIVGTLLGTILGWFLSEISRRGKLYIYAEMNDMFEHNHKGTMVISRDQDVAQFYSYSISIDLHNSSGDPRIMRKIELSFSNGKCELFRITPDDDNTGRRIGPMRYYDKIRPLTIPAKSVVTVNLHGGLWESEDLFSKIWETKEVYLIYKDDKNKEVKVLIKTEDFSCYFKNHSEKMENRT